MTLSVSEQLLLLQGGESVALGGPGAIRLRPRSELEAAFYLSEGRRQGEDGEGGRVQYGNSEVLLSAVCLRDKGRKKKGEHAVSAPLRLPPSRRTRPRHQCTRPAELGGRSSCWGREAAPWSSAACQAVRTPRVRPMLTRGEAQREAQPLRRRRASAALGHQAWPVQAAGRGFRCRAWSLAWAAQGSARRAQSTGRGSGTSLPEKSNCSLEGIYSTTALKNVVI